MIQSTLSRAIETLGINMPPAVQKADAVRAAIQSHLHAAVAEPLGDLRSSIAAGNLTPEQAIEAVNVAAHNRVIRQALLEVSHELESSLTSNYRAAVRTDASALMVDAGKVLDALAVELTGLADVLGPTPDVTSVAKNGPVVVEAFARFQKLMPKLSAMFMLVGEMHRLKLAPNQLNASTWVHEESIAAPGDLQRFGEAFGSSSKLLAIVGIGARLHLNTVEEAEAIQQKAARLDEERRTQEAATVPDRHGFR